MVHRDESTGHFTRSNRQFSAIKDHVVVIPDLSLQTDHSINQDDMDAPVVAGTKAEAEAKRARRAKIVFIILNVVLLDLFLCRKWTLRWVRASMSCWEYYWRRVGALLVGPSSWRMRLCFAKMDILSDFVCQKRKSLVFIYVGTKWISFFAIFNVQLPTVLAHFLFWHW